MTILPLFTTKTTKALIHNLREIAYGDMARQASGWITEENRIASNTREIKPIKLDFAVPKKHRLAWFRRSIQYLPH